MKLEINLNNTINNLIKTSDNYNLTWGNLKSLIQYLLISEYRTIGWFDKSIEKTTSARSLDSFWKKFYENKTKHQIIWEIQKTIEYLLIDVGFNILLTTDIFSNIKDDLSSINEFHVKNPLISKNFTKYINHLFSLFRNSEIENVTFYKNAELLENSKRYLFEIKTNKSFRLPDTAVVNLFLEKDEFDYPIIKIFPLTPKLAFCFVRQDIDNCNSKDLSDLIRDSYLNELFLELLENNSSADKTKNTFSNNKNNVSLTAILLNSEQIDYINKIALEQAYEFIVHKNHL